MSELDYGVSYIASAPEDFPFELQDVVEVIDPHADLYKQEGVVTGVCKDSTVTVSFDGYLHDYKADQLRKLPESILFENASIAAKIFEDSDNVKAFKTILNEMAETYKAKDADYGSAYDEGYRLFGHTQLLSRIYEKFSRVKHLLDGNKPNVAENICETLTDMAVQAICLRMLLQKNDFENVD